MLLSCVIPGLGQAISGFAMDGIYALIFVGGFGYLAVHNLAEGRVGETIAFGLGFSLAEYANPFGAYHAPERRYRISIGPILEMLREVIDPFRP